jgi:hypothetical protein
MGESRPSDTGKASGGRSAEITVSDTGIGIDPKDLDRVFDRFYQADSTHTAQYGGTGLGLALARELVELHKGHIVVASTLGKGSAFSVTLPLGKDHWCPKDIIAEETMPIGYTDGLPSALPVDEAVLTSEAPPEAGPATILTLDIMTMSVTTKGILKDTYRVESENGSWP